MHVLAVLEGVRAYFLCRNGDGLKIYVLLYFVVARREGSKVVRGGLVGASGEESNSGN